MFALWSLADAVTFLGTPGTFPGVPVICGVECELLPLALEAKMSK